MNKIAIVLFIILLTPSILLSQDQEGISFATVEKVPVFPGCVGEDNATLKKCMSKGISKHIAENFNIDEASKGMVVSGKYRVYVSFKIDTTGVITDIKSYAPTQAPSPALKKEAVRVMQLLPQLIPGQQKGKNVAVLYSLPITFYIEEDKKSKKNKKKG